MKHIKHSFPKSCRLKSRKKLQQLFAKGKSVRMADIRLVYLKESTQSDLKCGVGVSTRNFKNAVDRNRIKRLLREAYRLQQHELQQTVVTSNKSWSVFLLYTGKTLPTYTSIFRNVGVVLQKLVATDAVDTKST